MTGNSHRGPEAAKDAAVRPLNVCPHCRSQFVQPLSWRELRGGSIALQLRCPECLAWMAGVFCRERAEQLDRVLQRGRAELSRIYRQTVETGMRNAADRLADALARDLITADDFALPPRAVGRR